MNLNLVFSNYTKIASTILVTSILISGCSKTEPEPEEITPSIGEQVFNGTCKVCHAQGINGAPILGNKKMWQSRITKGVPTLIEHATNGFGLMPAKGGNTSLTDEEISAAVNFMVSKVQ